MSWYDVIILVVDIWKIIIVEEELKYLLTILYIYIYILIDILGQTLHMATETKKIDTIIDIDSLHLHDSPNTRVHLDVSWEHFYAITQEYTAEKKRES